MVNKENIPFDSGMVFQIGIVVKKIEQTIKFYMAENYSILCGERRLWFRLSEFRQDWRCDLRVDPVGPQKGWNR